MDSAAVSSGGPSTKGQRWLVGGTRGANGSNAGAVTPAAPSARYEGVGAYEPATNRSVLHQEEEEGDQGEVEDEIAWSASHSTRVRARRVSCGWVTSLLLLQSVNLAIIAGLATYYRWYGGGSTSRSPFSGVSPLPLPLQWVQLPNETTVLQRIAFGSCSRQDLPQPQWDTLRLFYRPDLVLLMGDNVYGDCLDASCDTLRNAYTDWANHPSLQGATQHMPLFATLDDHDYGQGDCHADNPHKELAKQLFADFFQLNIGGGNDTNDLPGPGEGVYRAHVCGPVGRRIQVILLDTRYDRSPFLETGNPQAPYTPYNTTQLNEGEVGDDGLRRPYRMLSTKQWAWLEDRLLSPYLDSSTPATASPNRVDLTFIVSSIQVLNDRLVFEGWRHLPNERDRLYNLIVMAQSTTRTKIVLLSGDRHVGGFYRHAVGELENATGTNIPNNFPLDGIVDEVTASSWTHTIPFGAYGSNCTSSHDCDEVDPTRIGDLIRNNHFGAIDVDWDTRTFTISLRRTEPSPDQIYVHQSRGDAGDVLQSRNYSLLQ